MFEAYIFEKLNVTLQGMDLFCYVPAGQISQAKLALFSSHANGRKFCHFSFLG